MKRNIVRIIKNLARMGRSDPRRLRRFVTSRVLIATGLSKHMVFQLGDIRLRFFPTRYCADLWFPDIDIYAHCRLPFLREGGTVVDVGANMGVLSLVFRKYVGAQGRVYAYEPHPVTFTYLKENILLNGADNIRAFNAAIGESKRTVPLTRNRNDTQNFITNDRQKGIEVSQETLDSVMNDQGIDRIDLLKVDTEGYELRVFQGASNVLRRTHVVIFEAIEDMCRRNNYGVADVVQLLQESEFLIYTQRRADGKFQPIDIDCFVERPHLFAPDLLASKKPLKLDEIAWI